MNPYQTVTVGQTTDDDLTRIVTSPSFQIIRLASIAGAAASVYHGYKRTRTVGGTILWTVFGGLLPFVAVPVAVAQGFGKRK